MQAGAKVKTFIAFYRLFPLIILIEGFVSIAVEILTIRQLLPFAGGSVIVTSIIIGIFLLFLALGYRHGGQHTENLQKKLRYNFFIAAIWIGIGLSYLFIELFFYSIQLITGPHIAYALIAYLLLITAPLIFLLGQTIPITLNMMKQTHAIGRVSGNTMALSTVGSFLGAVLTTLVLMYYLGVAWTVFINTMLLLLLFLILVEDILNYFYHIFFVAIVALGSYVLNIHAENNTFYLTNQYANYQILDSHNFKTLLPDEKILMINGGPSSFTNRDKKGFPYVEYIKKILFQDLKLRNANILVVGAGAFSLSAENTFQNNFIYVDIDKNLKKIAREKFGISENNLIVDDARHFLNSTNAHFDAIVLDAYNNIKQIAAYLITREYLLLALARLAPNGVVIINMLANPMLTDAYSKRADNTIRSVFGNCMAVPRYYLNRYTNIIYVCANTAQRNDRVIYSDNFNTSTTDSFIW